MRSPGKSWLSVCALAGTLSAAGCPHEHSHDDGDGHVDEGGHHHGEDGGDGLSEVGGEPTGTTCPDNSELTYENFAQPFFEDYCIRCHSSELSGAERMGATPAHDFDTRDGAYFVGDHIDQLAGSGPNATNRIMPPDGAKPTDEERAKLAEWLACDAP